MSLKLTDQQRAVADHPLGYVLVFSVADAGKPTAMIHRIERLVPETAFAPDRILATSLICSRNQAELSAGVSAAPNATYCTLVGKQPERLLFFRSVPNVECRSVKGIRLRLNLFPQNDPNAARYPAERKLPEGDLFLRKQIPPATEWHTSYSRLTWQLGNGGSARSTRITG